MKLNHRSHYTNVLLDLRPHTIFNVPFVKMASIVENGVGSPSLVHVCQLFAANRKENCTSHMRAAE